jgi:hypothetical protein
MQRFVRCAILERSAIELSRFRIFRSNYRWSCYTPDATLDTSFDTSFDTSVDAPHASECVCARNALSDGPGVAWWFRAVIWHEPHANLAVRFGLRWLRADGTLL